MSFSFRFTFDVATPSNVKQIKLKGMYKIYEMKNFYCIIFFKIIASLPPQSPHCKDCTTRLTGMKILLTLKVVRL